MTPVLPPGPTPIREDTAKLSDRVAVELGTRIVAGEFAPGDRLPTEDDLCGMFGVSRSVIRDAIRTLSARGLIDVRQGHGMRVTDPSDAGVSEALVLLLMRSTMTIGDVQEARAAIETELAPIAAARSEEQDWEHLEAELARYANAVAGRDWAEAQAAHLAFHFAVIHATHLPALEILLRPMQEIILITSFPSRRSEAELRRVWTQDDVALHQPIIAAIRNRSEAATREAMHRHFVQSYEHRGARMPEMRAIAFRDADAATELLRQSLAGTGVTRTNQP
jgi:DNA-binding FadR family transcriptional regulator